MGKCVEKQHQKEQAAHAHLAREAAKAITASSSASDDRGPVVSDLPEDPDSVISAIPDASIKPAKPSAKPHLQQCRAPSSVVPKQNPPHTQSSSMAMSSMPEDRPGAVNQVVVKNTRLPRKTAIAAQTLLQQVWINMDEDSEENSEDDSSEVETGSVTSELASELTTMAPPNKKSATTSASQSEKMSQVPPGPHKINSTNLDDDGDSDTDDDGEFSSVSYIYMCL